MIAEKTIQVSGKDVTLRYCAATETGFEQMSGRSSSIFLPVVVERNPDGKPKKVTPPSAVMEDYLMLACAAIIAAYARKGEDSPVSVDEILYDAPPSEVKELMTTVIELREKWYAIPEIVKPESKEVDDSKNA